MELFWIVGVPLVAGLVAAIPLFLVRTPWLVRISNWSIGGQVGLVVTSWLLLASIPGERNWDGSAGTCPDFSSAQGELLVIVAFASIAVGGIALASSVLGTWLGATGPWRVLAGLTASGLYVAVWIPFVLAAFCGFT